MTPEEKETLSKGDGNLEESILEDTVTNSPSTSSNVSAKPARRPRPVVHYTRRRAKMEELPQEDLDEEAPDQTHIPTKTSKDSSTVDPKVDSGVQNNVEAQAHDEPIESQEYDGNDGNESQDFEDENKGYRDNQRINTSHLLEKNTQSQIKVGNNHQANIIDCEEIVSLLREQYSDRDQALWIPPPAPIALSAEAIDDYVEEAVGAFKISCDRALFILLESGYNFVKAKEELAKRQLIVDEWTDDDRGTFRNAYNYFGKNFRLIQKALPHRPISSLVNYYYGIKRHAWARLQVPKNENFDDRYDDADDSEFGCCDHCGERHTKLSYTNRGRLCTSCFVYYTLMHKYRPIKGENGSQYRPTIQCPTEMADVVLEFEEIAKQYEEDFKGPKETDPKSFGSVVRSMEAYVQQRISEAEDRTSRIRSEIFSKTKKAEAIQTTILAGGVDSYRSFLHKHEPHDEEVRGKRARLDYKWTENERKMAFHCIARYGYESLDTVANILQTKNIEQVRAFVKENEKAITDFLRTTEAEEETLAKELDMEKELYERSDEVIDLE